MDKATAARATKKLESTGYVYRQQDPGDKRAYRVFVTEKGRNLEEKMMKIALKWIPPFCQVSVRKKSSYKLLFWKEWSRMYPGFLSETRTFQQNRIICHYSVGTGSSATNSLLSTSCLPGSTIS